MKSQNKHSADWWRLNVHRGLRIAAITLLVLVVGACTSKNNTASQAGKFGKAASSTATEELKGGIGEAVTTPLSDLNLRRKEIPPVLSSLSSPYDPVVDATCETLAQEISELNLVLGPDDDDQEMRRRGRGEKVGASAAGFALNAISDAAGDLIPLRSIVRRATGARRNESRYRSALSLGVKRRAHLKGIGTTLDCEPPAAPWPLSEPNETSAATNDK